MSTSAAFAAVAVTQSAAAQEAAHRAKISECKVTESTFDAHISTVAEKINYSECINILYPQVINDSVTILLKVLFVAYLIGFAWELIKNRQDYYINTFDYIITSAMHSLILPSILLVIYSISAGILWVVS